MLNEEQKMLYRGAAHLLSEEFVKIYIMKYPKRNMRRVAQRGLGEACRKFDPDEGYSFLKHAKVYIFIII